MDVFATKSMSDVNISTQFSSIIFEVGGPGGTSSSQQTNSPYFPSNFSHLRLESLETVHRNKMLNVGKMVVKDDVLELCHMTNTISPCPPSVMSLQLQCVQQMIPANM